MEPTSANLGRADFDPRAWVNAWISQGESTDDADALLSTGIVRLQLVMQECDDRIESAMSSIVGALPRALRDLRQTAETAAGLRAALQSSPASPPSAARGASEQAAGLSPPLHHIQLLEELDGVKQRLDAVRETLETAAAWERLSREADSALDSRSVSRMAGLLRAMRDTASALAELPGADLRAGTLADVERQFSDAVVPVLQAAARAADAMAMRDLAVMFERQLSQPLAPLEALAVNAAAPLLQAWVAGPSGSTPQSPLDEWLASWYGSACTAAVSASALAARIYSSFPEGIAEPTVNAEAGASSAGEVKLFVDGRRLQLVCRVLCTALGARPTTYECCVAPLLPVDAAVSLSLRTCASSAAPECDGGASTIIPLLLAESSSAPPSLLDWQGRLEVWSALPLPASDVTLLACRAAPPVAFVLRLLALAATGKDPSDDSLGGAASAARSASDASVPAQLNAAVISLLIGPSAVSTSGGLPKVAPSLVTTQGTSVVQLPVAVAQLVRLLQAFCASATSAPALVSVLDGHDTSQLPTRLQAARAAARIAVLAALAAPYDLNIAQLDGLARTILSELFRTIPGLPHPRPLDLRTNSAFSPHMAAQASGILLPPDTDSTPATNVPFSVHLRSLPLVALLQARPKEQRALDGGSVRIISCVPHSCTLQAQLEEPKVSPGVPGVAVSPGVGISSPARSTLAQVVPPASGASTATTASATVTASFADARRAAAACECAVARILLGSTALLTSCDVLTRLVEIRGVAAAIDEALSDVISRAHSSLAALHDAVFASPTAQVAVAAFATPASARELHGIVSRASLLSPGVTLAAAIISLQGSAALRYRLYDGSIARILSNVQLAGEPPQSLPSRSSSAGDAREPILGHSKNEDHARDAPRADLASAAATASLLRGGGHRVRTVVPALERLLGTSLHQKGATAAQTLPALSPPAAAADLFCLLPLSSAAAGRLGQTCARLGFELLVAPVALALRGVRHLPQWASGVGGSSAGAHGDDEGLDAYSLQPSAYATAIGDAAMRLVQHLAPHTHPLMAVVSAAGAAVGGSTAAQPPTGVSAQWLAALSAQALPLAPGAPLGHVAPLPLPLRFAVACHAAHAAAWIPALGAAELASGLEQCGVQTSNPSATTRLAHAQQAMPAVAGDSASDAAASALFALSHQLASAADIATWASTELVSSAASGGEAGAPHLPPSPVTAALPGLTLEAVTGEASLWLSSLARATSGLLLQEWAHIRRIDAGGARQLRADLQYVGSVLGSLGVSLHPATATFAELAAMPARELSKLVDASAATYAPAAPAVISGGRGGVVARAVSRPQAAPGGAQPVDAGEAAQHARDGGLRRLIAGMRGVMVAAHF